MGISTFPAPAAGGGESNDFILDKNGTTNTSFALPRSFAAGGYSVVVTGSTAYDLYLLDADGSAVGYTNGTSIVASNSFEEVSALGLGTADVVAFTYNGPSTNASALGDEPGAGAFLTSITPSDLPQIDDTAIVAGGNFASDVEVSFVSGTVTKAAKNVVVGSSTALVVTRPDDLIEDLAPYDLKAINPGVTEPTGSNANILAGTVTAGTDPSFVTTSPILGAFTATAFSTAILTSDSEGTVVNWQITAGTLAPGLSLATATGAISGTPSAEGDYYFTVQITDDGGNTNSAEFNLPVGLQVSGGASTAVGGTTYVYFTSSDDFVYKNADAISAEYIVIAGGGGGGQRQRFQTRGGGGGAGGLLFGTATLDGSDTLTVTVGAGGAAYTNGNNSTLEATATATAGGKGGAGVEGAGDSNRLGANGGSGGGGGGIFFGGSAAPGTGIAGQGNDGFGNTNDLGGGGGGAGAAATNMSGGSGANYGAWATAINIIYDSGLFAGGGAGGTDGTANGGGGPGTSAPGSANSGGGGGGGMDSATSGGAGGSGLVVVRFS